MASKRTLEILKIIDELYPDEKCHLEYMTAWQLLIATILSAQCTDERVNIITKDLFIKYPTIESFAKADVTELMEDIRTAGLFRNKAKNIIECMSVIHYEYNDQVPKDINELTKLAGVGRKTANVIRGNIYGEPSIVVDTHVKRISGRLGFTKESDPEKIEKDLMKVIPKESWIKYNHQIMAFGRQICKSQTPKCQECPLVGYCRHLKQSGSTKRIHRC